MIAELALVLALVTAHPQIYEGSIKQRPAVVHYSKTHFYVIYLKKHPWGNYPIEIVQVDAKTFEEVQLYISEEVLT
jgi:hypothetical protein